jgi:hypothetical protein
LNSLTTNFRKWCREAGLPDDCKLHGLRKAQCRVLAESNVQAKGIQAISGHRTLAEVQRYCDEANLKVLAVEAQRLKREAAARMAKPKSVTGLQG